MGGGSNVPGRMNKCGHGVTMYTYPAWTFGGKRRSEQAPPGPGPGAFVPAGTLGTAGPAFGRAPAAQHAPAHGPSVLGNAELAQGTLSGSQRIPAHSFGQRLNKNGPAIPGPQDYYAGPAWASTMTAHPAPGWGPPPARRPASAPRPMRVEERITPKVKGPSFGLPYLKKKESGPGPNQYQPNCGTGCNACEGYKGKSFGLRPPLIYGKNTTITPGPANYHVECSTIGAATQNCESGSSTFRRNRKA